MSLQDGLGGVSMSEPGIGDLYLARLLSHRSYRWSLIAVFFIIATTTLYVRVGLGWSTQVLPGYGILLSLYGFVMIFLSRDGRSRIAYGMFGLLVAAAFSRSLLPDHVRLVGIVEVIASLSLIASLMSLSRDEGFMGRGVLQSRSNEPPS